MQNTRYKIQDKKVPMLIITYKCTYLNTLQQNNMFYSLVALLAPLCTRKMSACAKLLSKPMWPQNQAPKISTM